MSRPRLSDSGASAKCPFIGVTISRLPRAVYELALDNMRKVGVSNNEALICMYYYWANLPSNISIQYELQCNAAKAAEDWFAERMNQKRKEMMKEAIQMKKVADDEIKAEEEEQDKLYSVLRPIVSRYSRGLNFDAERGTRQFEEHNIALADIGLALEEKTGITRLDPKAVRIVYESLSEGCKA